MRSSVIWQISQSYNLLVGGGVFKEEGHCVNNMDIEIVIGIIAVVLFVLFLIWFFSTWNRLVSLEENVNRSWSNIDVLLKQRYDMIPNLINIVKGYAKHESAIWQQFADARKMAAGALATGDVAGVSKAESMLAGMLPKINVIAEQYPELKANDAFLSLQNQLVSLENQIADRRELFNATATSFNKVIQMIPTSIVASVKSCERRELFLVRGIERENVNIQF